MTFSQRRTLILSLASCCRSGSELASGSGLGLGSGLGSGLGDIQSETHLDLVACLLL